MSHRLLDSGRRFGVFVAGAAAVVGLLVVSAASAAKARPTVAITVTVIGNGIVSLPIANARFGCGGSRTCTHTFHIGRGRRVALTGSPEKTWKLTRWGGACKATGQTCSLGRVTAPRSVKVRFVPPGTRLNPYPLGTAVGIAPGWKMTVNSAIINADAQVEAVTDPSGNHPNDGPAPGAQYVLVNLTMKNLSVAGSPPLGYVQGLDSSLYSPDSFCTPPSPDLASAGKIEPGQTVTGNVCYVIESHDAGTLMLKGEEGGGGCYCLHTVWLALRTKNRTLLAAPAAYSQPQRALTPCGWPVSCYHGYVTLTISGRGSVKLNNGFVYPQTLRCSSACTSKMRVYRTRGPRVALTETPYKGWKFTGWSGFCKSKKPTCAIDLPQVNPSQPGGATQVTGRFIR